MINEIDWNQSDILHLRFLLLKMEWFFKQEFSSYLVHQINVK